MQTIANAKKKMKTKSSVSLEMVMLKINRREFSSIKLIVCSVCCCCCDLFFITLFCNNAIERVCSRFVLLINR